jgi:putative intracellular protease/amidase
MKILMVVASHEQLGSTGHKTGVWLEEFVAPYFVVRERIGGIYENAPDWVTLTVVDGRVLTGQNPVSSTAAAEALMELLATREAAA